jgi:hypothetical protein
MRVYQQDAEVARKIYTGSGLDNIKVSSTEFYRMATAELGQTLATNQANGLMPSMFAYHKTQVAEGVAGYSTDVTSTAVQATINTIVGPAVNLNNSQFNERYRTPIFANSPDTRSYRRDGEWVDPDTVRKELALEITDPKYGTFGGYTLAEVAITSRIQIIGNGRYILNVPQPDGSYAPLRMGGLITGEMVVLDLLNAP